MPMLRFKRTSKMVESVSRMIRDAAQRLPDIDHKGFGASFDDFANHRVVLIGDARYPNLTLYHLGRKSD